MIEMILAGFIQSAIYAIYGAPALVGLTIVYKTLKGFKRIIKRD